MDSDEETEKYTSPRPAPQFYQEQQTFSTKKAKLAQGLIVRTPHDSAPPRPPVKSAPPVSRIFPNRRVVGPRPVWFRKAHSLDSQFYNGKNKQTYFEQCFSIISKIGQGSFGEVFKVRSKDDNQLYAVKKAHIRFRGESDRQEILPTIVGIPTKRRRRKLEEVAKYEMLPEHRNLVKFYRAWEEDLILYIQMELCQTSLNQLALQRHNIPEMAIWYYLIDLILAVKHLHDHKLVHMDIKPENIFITANNYCKLGDFGLVLDLSKNKDYSESTEGDAKYLAPELLDGRFGKPADIFSLGMTIMELASDLDLPRGGEMWHKLRQRELPIEFIRSRSTSLKSVISLMLEPDLTKRPTIDDLLELSSLRKYMKSRLNHYSIMQVWRALLRLLAFLTSSFLALFKTRGSSAPLPNMAKLQSRANTSALDDEGAPSDEEMQDDSLSSSLLAVPFDDSRAEDEVDGFFMGSLPPQRQVASEPVLRYRSMRSPISSSPLLTRKKHSDLPTSPVNGPMVNHSFDSEKSTPPRPRILFPINVDEEEEKEKKAKIEPRNLMQMFNDASDDEI